MKRVAIIGQGYVGLPLSIAAAQAGNQVLGFDVNESLISNLNNGISNIEDVRNKDLKQVLSLNKFKASSNLSDLKNHDVYIICVPTPLTVDGNPDTSKVIAAIKTLVQFPIKGKLLILESTVAPGTTRKIFTEIIESSSSLKIDDLEIAYSPERVDPKNALWNITNTPKLVAGLTATSRDLAKEFYSKFVNTLVECDSLEVAETAKLLENSFRLINISFINELARFCTKLGISILDVIAGAATKPYGFMPFYPSVGAGGHCIPVDPIYLSNVARQFHSPITLIELAHDINKEIPGYHVQRAKEKLGNLKGKEILVIGVSYKPDVADVRDTPVRHLISKLRSEGARVSWHDNLVLDWDGEKSVELRQGFDLAILATFHSYIELKKLGDTMILDTRDS
jgi:UDP-N-acetyl-D-glucosamine dehydrogenase